MPTNIDMAALDRAHDICIEHAPDQAWACGTLCEIIYGPDYDDALDEYENDEQFWSDLMHCVEIVDQRTAHYKHGRDEYDAIKAAYDWAEQKDKG